MKIGRELAIVFLESPIKVGTRIPPYKNHLSLAEKDITIIGYPETKVQYNFINEKMTE